MRVHADELRVDEGTVAALVRAQFPQWADRPVHRLQVDGTVNAIFRIGEDLAVRMPMQPADPVALGAALAAEAEAMRALGSAIPFPAPEPLAIGQPDAAYPLPWSVQTWLPGAVADPVTLARSEALAADLILLISSMRAPDTHGRTFDRAGRGGDLTHSDGWVAECLRQSEGLLPVERLAAYWKQLRTLPRTGTDVMTHGDLIPGNILVQRERLVGVLDGGAFGPADPALDLIAAWHLFDAPPRDSIRQALGSSDIEWLRGAAWAFEQSMGLVWYYRESLPRMSALGRSTLARLGEDPEVREFVGGAT
ncbi:phosphotransferase [Curtobacterium ammoniigenes]|uniref:phosphotransferase n=1 Tax=Curtobacterium ammoniigenes TaxID=395387 RepID=UPI000830614C|nr:phosphotransferase [Curtobacterium ammoniigenes]